MGALVGQKRLSKDVDDITTKLSEEISSQQNSNNFEARHLILSS